MIFYWYTPQYLNQEYDLAEVKLPPRSEAAKDCQDDAKAGGDPEQYKCEYDVTTINKLFSKKFAEAARPPSGAREHDAHQRAAGGGGEGHRG